jgi:hypothetical protein
LAQSVHMATLLGIHGLILFKRVVILLVKPLLNGLPFPPP